MSSSSLCIFLIFSCFVLFLVKSETCANENFKTDTNCTVCVNNYDIAEQCTVCWGRWDISKSCASCLPGWTGTYCLEREIPNQDVLAIMITFFSVLLFFVVFVVFFCVCCALVSKNELFLECVKNIFSKNVEDKKVLEVMEALETTKV